MGAFLQGYNIWSMVFRLAFAALASGVIGLEREQKRRPAGFRTYMLVGCGATVTVLIGQYLLVYWGQIDPSVGVDPSRISAQVINGIGFLGAGTIIVTDREKVKGLTTAAGLWTTACLGLVIGIGSYYCAFLGCLLIFICLRIEKGVENNFMSRSRNINVYIEMNKITDLREISSCIKDMGFQIYDFELISKKTTAEQTAAAVFYLAMEKGRNHDLVIGELSEIEKVMRIEEA